MFKLIKKEIFKWSIQNLISLISKQRSTARININDIPIINLIDTYQHNRATTVSPILQNNLIH